MTITRYFSAPAAHGEASPTGARQAYLMLRTVFTIAPIAFGLDKFFNILTDWEQYLAPWINDIVPGSAHQAMLAVGVVEILAGVLVAVRPAIGAYVVPDTGSVLNAAWDNGGTFIGAVCFFAGAYLLWPEAAEAAEHVAEVEAA